MERRYFILGVTSAITLGTAGCMGNATTEDDSPEDVLEAFFTATADGDIEEQTELLHEESSIEPIEEKVELTIAELEPTTLEEIAAERGVSASEAVIEQQRERLNERMDEIGADDYTHLFYSIETEEYGARDGYMILAEDNSEWRVYQDIRADGNPTGGARAPQVSVEYERRSESELAITHGGGDDLDASRVTVSVGDDTSVSESTDWEATGWDETIQVGDTLTLTDRTETDHSGEQVTVVWTESDTGSPTVISSSEWPE